MRERPEIHLSGEKGNLPDETLINEVAAKLEKQRSLSLADFENVMTVWRREGEQEKTPEAKAANLTLIDTVESLVKYVIASKWEMEHRDDKWKKINKLKAAKAASNTMFTADVLSQQPELLSLFWNKIFTPLTESSGQKENELKSWEIGFMAELAVGKALDYAFRISKQNLAVFKGTPLEDVKEGKDLVVASSKEKELEWPLQVKVSHGGGETFVQWDNGVPPMIILYYRKDASEFFNLQNGKPTNLLIQELAREAVPKFKQLPKVA